MWEDVYSRHSPELLRYSLRFCGSPAEAEDAVQETFLRALQTGDAFLDLGPSQRRAWLYRTLKRLLCDRYRREVRETACLDRREADAALDPELEQVETILLLQKLPEPDRTLFYLRYLEDYTAAELALMFSLPPGTVRSKLSRSRQILRQHRIKSKIH